MEYRIKILKDTPFDKANTILSTEDFRYKYSYLINTHNSDKFLAEYLSKGYLKDHLDVNLSEWFEVIEIKERFKVGDWVWNEDRKLAFTVVVDNSSSGTKEWKPNFATLDAVNMHQDVYKRLATKEEIDYHTLHSFCDGGVLIGAFKCYYFNNVWKELIGIHSNVSTYLNMSKQFNQVSILDKGTSNIEFSYNCGLGGLIVGCKTVSHNEVKYIAKILNLI